MLRRFLTFASLAAFLVLPATSRAGGGPAATQALEREVAAAARAGRWSDALKLLSEIYQADPVRYGERRFDYLTARALAGAGRSSEALPRLERYVATGDLFDVPARLVTAQLRFGQGETGAALDLLLPLLGRRDGAVSRRAIRIALDALETRFDAPGLERLAAAHAQMPARERRRLQALQAEALERKGQPQEAAALRASLLGEGRRDDAAAILLARELRDRPLPDLPDGLLVLLIDTARAQRDLELAERLAVERERRAAAQADPIEHAGALFDLTRLRGSRGKFAEAAAGFRQLLDAMPKAVRVSRKPSDDSTGTAGFLSRVRFNLGAVLEKLGDLDGASREFERVEASGAGPARLAALQRARISIRRGAFARAFEALSRPALAREAGRTEALLLLVGRSAEAGEGRLAARALAEVERLPRGRRLAEPWRTELPFWRGRVAEALGSRTRALSAYTEMLAARPGSPAAERARARLLALDRFAREAFLARRRSEGEALLKAGHARDAVARLLPGAQLGDAAARSLLKVAYSQLKGYSEVLLLPDLAEESLPDLCGDAAACKLLQLGLARDAEPIVRDARHLDSLLGCILAARLAEVADAGVAALEAAEALARKIPDDLLLDLAPRNVVRALAPRPFADIVATTASEMGVPEDLLYAVMRQESRFDREAASPAAARGLMQLTLPAAGEAARELHEEPPAYTELYDPVRSIRLGGRTLKTLLERFDGDATSAVSAYNAGAGQTTLWIAGSRLPSEALLGAVSYVETRTYLRRVLTNQFRYRAATSSGPRR